MKFKEILGIFVLIILATWTITYIPDLLCLGSEFGKIIVVPILLLFFLYINGLKKVHFKSSIGKILTCSIIFIYLWEIILALFTNYINDYFPFYTFLLFSLIILFFSSIKTKSIIIEKAFNILFYISLIIIISGILAFVLLSFNIQLGETSISTLFGPNFELRSHASGIGGEYGYIRLMFFFHVYAPDTVRAFFLFQKFGTFMGISYEPHINMFFITPFIIYYLTNIKIEASKKYFILVVFIFYSLMSISATFLMCIAIVFGVYLIAHKTNISFFIALIIIYLITPKDYFHILTTFLEGKIDSGSNNISSSYLDYIISGISINNNSFWGKGLLIVPEVYNTSNYGTAGFISSLLFFTMYTSSFILSIKLIRIESLQHYGYSFIYVLLHTLKFPIHVMGCPILIFWIFSLLLIFENHRFNVSR